MIVLTAVAVALLIARGCLSSRFFRRDFHPGKLGAVPAYRAMTLSQQLRASPITAGRFTREPLTETVHKSSIMLGGDVEASIIRDLLSIYLKII